MFCTPGFVFGGTEGVWYRFALPDSFSTVTGA
jgi:hypothetical protein